jgi:acyl carrier protein
LGTEIPEEDYGKITTIKTLVSYILDKKNSIGLLAALL